MGYKISAKQLAKGYEKYKAMYYKDIQKFAQGNLLTFEAYSVYRNTIRENPDNIILPGHDRIPTRLRDRPNELIIRKTRQQSTKQINAIYTNVTAKLHEGGINQEVAKEFIKLLMGVNPVLSKASKVDKYRMISEDLKAIKNNLDGGKYLSESDRKKVEKIFTKYDVKYKPLDTINKKTGEKRNIKLDTIIKAIEKRETTIEVNTELRDIYQEMVQGPPTADGKNSVAPPAKLTDIKASIRLLTKEQRTDIYNTLKKKFKLTLKDLAWLFNSPEEN